MQSWPPGIIAEAVFFLEDKVGRVLCYGVIGVDHLIQVNAYPESNGHARVLRDELQIGGEAVNTAVRLSQLDIPVTLMGNPVGSDDLGRHFLDQISGHNIDCRIGVREGETGRAYVVSDANHTRTIFGAFGNLKGPAVPYEDLTDISLISLDPFLDGAIDVARQARENQIPVVSIEIEPLDPLASLSDTVVNSAGFLRRHQAGNPEEMALGLLKSGVSQVILTRGNLGADYFSHTDTFHQPVFSVDVVDTTGAGDGFRAGLIAGMIRRQSPVDCVKLASAVGALSCCYHGGCGGFVSLDVALETSGLA